MREVALFSRKGAAARGAARNRTHRYWAFLSYSHKDSPTADWLHGALERYRVPRSLVGREGANGVIPPSFSPIFRDRHELAAAGDLGHTIREALAASRCLIVLCSPEAAASRWTNEEILAFKKAHPRACVLAAIIAGEPFASETPGREAEECFPPALRQKYDSRGRPTGKRAEPIAADLRETGDGRQLGLLKLVAGMIGVGLDDLVQRDQQRKQRRLTYIAAASLAGMTVASGLAVFAFDKRDEARDQRREAEGLVGFMLGDLRQKLEPIGRLDALDAVGARALAYYQQQDKTELSDESLAQRSKALTLMGEIANRRGDIDRALALYQEALAGTTEALRRDPDEPQRVFDQSQNVFWVGAIAYQRGSLDQAEASWREYKRLADQLVAMAPGNKDWLLEPIYADTNLGIVLDDKHRYRDAVAVFARLLKNVEQLASAEPGNRAYQDQLSEALAWLAQSTESAGRLDDALGHREHQLALMGRRARGGADAPLKRDMMVAHRAAGRLFGQRGNAQEGLGHFARAIAIGNDLMQTEPNSSEYAEAVASTYFDFAELQLPTGRAEGAAASVRSGCNLVQRLISGDSSVAYWRAMKVDCSAMRARIALAQGALEEARANSSDALAQARANAVGNRSANRAFALASAYLLRGQVARATGDPVLAMAQFKAALASWPANVEMTARQTARKLLILEGLGMHAEAAGLQRRLAAMGYRNPDLARERRLVRG